MSGFSLQLPDELQKYAGGQSAVTVAGPTYLDLIRNAAQLYPALGERLLDPNQRLFGHWVVLEDGQPLPSTKLENPLPEDVGKLEIFGLASGG